MYSLLNVKINTEKLAVFFENASTLRLVHRATSPPPDFTGNNAELTSYLNPIRPAPLQLIGKCESEYLNALSEQAQITLIEQLNTQHTQCLVFEHPSKIPTYFFQQNTMHLVQSNTFAPYFRQQLNHELNERFSERRSQHGAFIIVYGQGILITGDSGTGKSSLLLNLVKRGHLWVADDMILFYLDINGQVIGHAEENLSKYIHIKGLGPIHMDKTYGLACRTRSHPLAATIHLSDNANQKTSAYTQRDTMTVLNRDFSKWHLASSRHDLPCLVESCAKNILLQQWDCDPANELEKILNDSLLS